MVNRYHDTKVTAMIQPVQYIYIYINVAAVLNILQEAVFIANTETTDETIHATV